MPEEVGQPDPESEDVLLKNLAWAQAAWIARMAWREGKSVGETPQKKLIEWTGKWREDHADAHTAAERYPLPNGFLAGDALYESRIDSQNLRRSLAAYEERTGAEARAPDIDAFRAAAGPLVRESKRTGRVFSERLLDLVAAQGGEHSVIFTPGRVLKVTEPDTAGAAVTFARDGEPRVFLATLPEYVRQLEQNVALAGDDTRIEGVMIGANGEIRIVTSQTAVHGIVPTYEEIETELRGNGFLPVKQEWVLGQEGPEMWWNPESNVAIADAKPANLVKTDSGEIVPIDVKAFQPTGKALEWMRAHAIWTWHGNLPGFLLNALAVLRSHELPTHCENGVLVEKVNRIIHCSNLSVVVFGEKDFARLCGYDIALGRLLGTVGIGDLIRENLDPELRRVLSCFALRISKKSGRGYGLVRSKITILATAIAIFDSREFITQREDRVFVVQVNRVIQCPRFVTVLGEEKVPLLRVCDIAGGRLN